MHKFCSYHFLLQAAMVSKSCLTFSHTQNLWFYISWNTITHLKPRLWHDCPLSLLATENEKKLTAINDCHYSLKSSRSSSSSKRTKNRKNGRRKRKQCGKIFTRKIIFSSFCNNKKSSKEITSSSLLATAVY